MGGNFHGDWGDEGRVIRSLLTSDWIKADLQHGVSAHESVLLEVRPPTRLVPSVCGNPFSVSWPCVLSNSQQKLNRWGCPISDFGALDLS